MGEASGVAGVMPVTGASALTEASEESQFSNVLSPMIGPHLSWLIFHLANSQHAAI